VEAQPIPHSDNNLARWMRLALVGVSPASLLRRLLAVDSFPTIGTGTGRLLQRNGPTLTIRVKELR
jgi:hypothetical protein